MFSTCHQDDQQQPKEPNSVADSMSSVRNADFRSVMFLTLSASPSNPTQLGKESLSLSNLSNLQFSPN